MQWVSGVSIPGGCWAAVRPQLCRAWTARAEPHPVVMQCFPKRNPTLKTEGLLGPRQRIRNSGFQSCLHYYKALETLLSIPASIDLPLDTEGGWAGLGRGTWIRENSFSTPIAQLKWGQNDHKIFMEQYPIWLRLLDTSTTEASLSLQWRQFLSFHFLKSNDLVQVSFKPSV